MSYNIDRVEYNGNGRLTINTKTARMLLKKYKDHLPEDCFLWDIEEPEEGDDDVVIERPAWRGESSGYFYDTFLEILKETKGHAKMVIVWEGGDSMTALEVKDGKVKEKKPRIVVD